MRFFELNIKVGPSGGAVQHNPQTSSEVKIERNQQGHQNSYTLTVGKEKYAISGEKTEIDKFEKFLKNNPQGKDFKISIDDKYRLKIDVNWSISEDITVNLSRETTQTSFNQLCKFLGKETSLLQFYPVEWGTNGRGLSLLVLKNNPEAAKYIEIKPGDGKYLIKSHQGGTITVANNYQDALARVVQIREAIGQTNDQEYFNFKAQLLISKKDSNGLIKHLSSNRGAAAAFVDKYQPGLIDASVWAEKKYEPIKFAQDERAHMGLAKLTEDKSAQSQKELEFIYSALVKSGNRPLATKFFDRLPAGLKDFKLTTIEKYAERDQRAVQSTMAGLEKMDKAQLKDFIQNLKKNPAQALPHEMMRMISVKGREHAKAQIQKIIVESEKILKQIEENEKMGQKSDLAVLPRLLALLAPEQSADLIDDYSLSEQSKSVYKQELSQIDFYRQQPTPQKKLEMLNKYIEGLDDNQKTILREKFGLNLPLTLADVSKMELTPLKFLTKGGGKEGVTYFLGVKNANGTTNYINLSELQMYSNVPEKINIYKEVKNRSELFNTFASDNALPRVSYYIGVREDGTINVVSRQELGKQINDKVKEYSAYVLIGAGMVATFASGGTASAAGALLIAGALHQLADAGYEIYLGNKYNTMSVEEFNNKTQEMGMTIAMMATGPIKGFKGTLIRTGLMIPDSIHTYQALNDPNLSQAEKNEALAFYALNAAMFLWAEKGSLRTRLAEMKTKNPSMHRELNSMGISENTVPPSGAKEWLQKKMSDYLSKEISRGSNRRIISGMELHSYGRFKPVSGKDTIGFFDGKKAIKVQKNELKAYYEIERGTAGNIAKYERAGAVNARTGEIIRPDQEFFAMNIPREKFSEMIKILDSKNIAQFEKFCRENNIVFRGLESEGHVSVLKVFENYHSEKNTASIASEDSNAISAAMRKQIIANKDLVRFEVQPPGTKASVSDTVEGGLVFIRGEKKSQGKIVFAKEGFVKQKLASAAQTLSGTKGIQNRAIQSGKESSVKTETISPKTQAALERIFNKQDKTISQLSAETKKKIDILREKMMHQSQEIHNAEGYLPDSKVRLKIDSRGLKESSFNTGNGDRVYHADFNLNFYENGSLVSKPLTLLIKGDVQGHGIEATKHSFIYDQAHGIALEKMQSGGPYRSMAEALELYRETRERVAYNLNEDGATFMTSTDFFIDRSTQKALVIGGEPIYVVDKQGNVEMKKIVGGTPLGMEHPRENFMSNKFFEVNLSEKKIISFSDAYSEAKYIESGKEKRLNAEDLKEWMTEAHKKGVDPQEYVQQKFKSLGAEFHDDQTYFEIDGTGRSNAPKKDFNLTEHIVQTDGETIKIGIQEHNKTLQDISNHGDPDAVIKYYNENGLGSKILIKPEQMDALLNVHGVDRKNLAKLLGQNLQMKMDGTPPDVKWLKLNLLKRE